MANPFANESTAIRVGPVESVLKSNLSSALALESKRNLIRKEFNNPNLTNEEVDRIIYLRENPEMPPSIGPAITHRDAYGRPLSLKLVEQRNKEHLEKVLETVNRNNGLRTFGYSNLSDKQAEQNPELVSLLEKDAAADITAKGLTMAAFIPGMQWLRGVSAPLYYGVNAGLTGASAYDWYKNGPNFWNVTGTIGGGFDLFLPAALRGYLNYLLSKALNQGINDIQTVKLPYNIGWGPRYSSMWDYILKKRPSVSNKTYSINSSEAHPYLTNGLWDMPRIKKDLLAGRLDFIDWIESSAYKAAAEANKKEAEAMGLKYVPTYEYPAYLKFKDHGIQTVFVTEPSNNAQGWVGTYAGSPITINLANVKNIRSVNAHESAHAARHAWLDPEYPLLDVKKLQAYLRYKNAQVFKDDADLSLEAGNRFYDFSSTGYPHEAVTNSRDLGKLYGIKVGQEYPGPEKTLELLNRMELEAKPGFLKKFIQSFRRDPEHLEFVWKALNGTLWMLIPTIVGTNYIMNNEKD